MSFVVLQKHCFSQQHCSLAEAVAVEEGIQWSFGQWRKEERRSQPELPLWEQRARLVPTGTVDRGLESPREEDSAGANRDVGSCRVMLSDESELVLKRPRFPRLFRARLTNADLLRSERLVKRSNRSELS